MTNANESAYPILATEQHHYNQNPTPHQEGLTKREYFAAMAMQGFISNPDTNGMYSQIAEWSVNAADALINELNKPQS